MEAVAVVAVIAAIWGLAFAVVYATKAVGRTISDGYHKRVEAARKRFGGGGSPEGTGSRIGNGLAALFITLPMWLGALRRGWVAGWRDGRQRAHERFGDLEPEQPTEPEQPQPTEPAPVAEAQIPQQPGGDNAVVPEQPETPAEPAQPDGDNQAQPQNPTIPAQPVPVSGGNTMPIATTTGGEVTSVETALAELQQIRAEAAANLEDAQADAARAGEDAKRVELFAASMAKLEFGAEIIAESQAMQDTAAQAAHAASIRKGSAEQRLGQVTKLIPLMQRHLAIQEIGASVGGVANNKAY